MKRLLAKVLYWIGGALCNASAPLLSAYGAINKFGLNIQIKAAYWLIANQEKK